MEDKRTGMTTISCSSSSLDFRLPTVGERDSDSGTSVGLVGVLGSFQNAFVVVPVVLLNSRVIRCVVVIIGSSGWKMSAREFRVAINAFE